MSRQTSISSFFKRTPANPPPEELLSDLSEPSGDTERRAAIRTCVGIHDCFIVCILGTRVDVHRHVFREVCNVCHKNAVRILIVLPVKQTWMHRDTMEWSSGKGCVGIAV